MENKENNLNAAISLIGDLPVKPIVLKYCQEFDAQEGRHRIVCSDGRKTNWAHYQGYAYLDGYVSCTAYFLDKEGLYTAHEFLSQTGYGLE